MKNFLIFTKFAAKIQKKQKKLHEIEKYYVILPTE